MLLSVLWLSRAAPGVWPAYGGLSLVSHSAGRFLHLRPVHAYSACMSCTGVLLIMLSVQSVSHAEQVTFSDERDCQWRWYRSGQRSADTAAHDSQGRPPSPRRRSPSPSPHGFGNSHEVSGTEGGFAAWQLLPGADQRVYIPTPEDAGHRLRVECIPTR